MAKKKRGRQTKSKDTKRAVVQAPTPQEEVSGTQAPLSTSQNPDDKFQWWKIAATFAVALATFAVALITAMPWLMERPAPIFTPENPVINPRNRNLILIAGNKSAKRKSPLDVQFDGLIFQKRGNLYSESQKFQWTVAFKKFLPQPLLKDGPYSLRLRFPDGKFSESQTIQFSSKSRQENISTQPDTPRPPSTAGKPGAYFS